MEPDSPASLTIAKHGLALIDQARSNANSGDKAGAIENFKKGTDILNLLISSTQLLLLETFFRRLLPILFHRSPQLPYTWVCEYQNQVVFQTLLDWTCRTG
jgi:hypothetical protein